MAASVVKYLANLGYGNRRDVTRMVDQRRVTDINGRTLTAKDTATHAELLVDGVALDPPAGSVLMLHKPVDYTCSTTDSGSVIYELLPWRFRARSPIMAPVGRLDRDTSGLLLLTDDGQFNHRVTSPKSHLSKTYEATLATPLRGDEHEIFSSGTLMLERESEPLKPATLETRDERRVLVTITEGRYHQVRRMFAAVGNHVVTLHRTAISSLTLGDLAAGAWRVLTDDERQRVTPSRAQQSSSPAAL